MDVKKGYMKVGDDTVLPITSYDCIIDKDGNKLAESAESITQNTKAVANIGDYLGIDITKKRNLFDKYACIAGHRVSGTDGNISTFPTLCSVSDFIDVSGISRITISGQVTAQNSTNHMYAFFNENKEYVSGLQIDGTELLLFNGTIDVPSNARYIRINFMPQDNVMVCEGTSGVYVPYVPTLKSLAETSGIVAYGGNDTTGYYVRFANGVQMCWLTKRHTGVNFTTAWGGLYDSPTMTGANYPVPFVNGATTQSITVTGGTHTCFAMCVYGYTFGNKWTDYKFDRPTSVSDATVEVSLFAIGRWK